LQKFVELTIKAAEAGDGEAALSLGNIFFFGEDGRVSANRNPFFN
jgi:TPR repeat protein